MLTVHYLHYGGCQLIQVRGLSTGALLVEGIPGTAVLLHSTCALDSLTFWQKCEFYTVQVVYSAYISHI